MINHDLYVILMAGGVGTRFWPYSTQSKPKQFLDVLGTGKTLLQSTYERFEGLCPPENIYLVTHEKYRELTQQQLPQLIESQIITEPMRKNTAPCILYATHKIQQKNPNALMVVAPSDHLILNEADFKETIVQSVQYAKDHDHLVTLGIKPTRPETGYGYIQYIENKNPIKKVKTFTEKPEYALAKKFLESGDFLWNAGIFVWNAKTIMKCFEKYLPEMSEIFDEASEYISTPQEKTAIQTAYLQVKNISIDYGILEKADNVFVVASQFSWSDLGSWASLYKYFKQDEVSDNVIHADAMVYDTHHSIIKADKNKLIVAQGLENYLIAAFGNVVMVCKKDNEDFFRRVLNDLKDKPNGNEFM